MAGKKRSKSGNDKPVGSEGTEPTLPEERHDIASSGGSIPSSEAVTGLNILAWDPGVKNFAFCHWIGEVKEVGWVRPLVDVNNDVDFVNDIIELLTRIKPDYVVLERFMVRNRGQSIFAEKINQELGRIAVLARMVSGLDLIQLTAAQWKTWWLKTKKQNWEEVYSDVESVHQRDACGIALYASEEWIPKHLTR